MKKFCLCILISVFLFVLSCNNADKTPKVLAVFSYEEDSDWCQPISSGIRDRLKDRCELKFFYMNTKTDPSEKNKTEMAKKAFDLVFI